MDGSRGLGSYRSLRTDDLVMHYLTIGSCLGVLCLMNSPERAMRLNDLSDISHFRNMLSRKIALAIGSPIKGI